MECLCFDNNLQTNNQTTSNDFPDYSVVVTRKSEILQKLRTYLLQTQSKQISKETTQYICTQFAALDDIISQLAGENRKLKGELETYKRLGGGNPQTLEALKDTISTTIKETVQQEITASFPTKAESYVPGDTGATFASVTRRPATKRSKAKQPISVFIEETEATKQTFPSIEALKEGIKKTINPAQDGLRINNFFRTKKGLIIQTQNREDAGKLLKSKKLTELGVNISFKPQRLPRMIIYDVPSEYDADSIKAIFWSQNGKSLNKDVDKFNPVFKTGARGQATVNWVVEVNHTTRKELNREGRVFFEWHSCRIKDWIQISQCYKCLGFGHIARDCKAPKFKCGHCADEGHEAKVCPGLVENKPPKCTNCSKVKKDANHPATAKECPFRMKAIERRILESYQNYDAE